MQDIFIAGPIVRNIAQSTDIYSPYSPSNPSKCYRLSNAPSDRLKQSVNVKNKNPYVPPSKSTSTEKDMMINKELDKINICFAIDDKYAEYCSVAIVSILKNSCSSFHFFILHAGLNIENIQNIERLKNIRSFDITFVEVNLSHFENCYLPPGAHFSLANYYRLKIASLLPHLDKVIYLDSDIVVNRDLRELWETPLNDYYVGACKEMMHERACERLALPKGSLYINSGVLVLNLEKIRQNKIEDKFFDCIKVKPEILQNVDQDVINLVLLEASDGIKQLPQNWNAEDRTDQPYKKEYLIILNEPYIIHFVTNEKPWHPNSKQLYKERYWEYHKYLEPLSFDQRRTRESYIIEKYFNNDRSVRQGPFKGMNYSVGKSIGSALLPKIYGSYEEPIQKWILEIISKKYENIIDIGCAEGYYAVGLALTTQKSKVYAYDTDPEALLLCKDLARSNNVESKIVFNDLFTHKELENFGSKKTMVICDIEGDELHLLNPSLANGLQYADMIIEAHDFIVDGISETLIARFKHTHKIEMIVDYERASGMALGENINEEILSEIIDERRPVGMKWLRMISLKNHQQSLNETVAQGDALLSPRDGQIVSLKQAVAARDITIQARQDSHSWRVTAPLRALSRYIRVIKHISEKFLTGDKTNELMNALHVVKMEIENSNLNSDYEYYKGLDPDNYADELKRWYKRWSGKPLNLEHPQTFNEKIQWLKLHDSTKIKTQLTDKYLVRGWVKERIGEKYIIPLLGVWDKFDDIDFDRLPDKFVLKANHGCGWNIIVKDKSLFDKAAAKREFSKWLNTNFAFINGLELHYKGISPKIIAEEFIENEGIDLYDYKIWCFNGIPKFIAFLAERQAGLKMSFYDLAWNLLPFTYIYPQYKKLVKKPDNLDEMIHIAKKLCKDFIHVRVDLYRLDDGSLKFGEMTFTTASGQCSWNPPEYDLLIGQMIALPGIKKINTMSKRLGIKNFLKMSLVTLAKTFNRNIERVTLSVNAEKPLIREDKILVREEKKPPEIIRTWLEDAAAGIGSVPKTMINFCVPLAEHCNLRCRGCDHFAPIAVPEFADTGAFENDFARLSYLLNGEAVKIGLMGGEPLLHPKVKDFLYIARKYFRQTKLRIVTNGVLLLKQNEDFWNACQENNIIVEVTKYPINLDFAEMRNVADSYGVSLAFYDNTGDVQKTSNHLPLDINGGQDIRRNFTKCYHANNTIFLKRGRLYTCTIAPNVHHFNKFFNVDMQTSDNDSIDIYEAQSAREIFQFLSKPIQFCRYCHVDKRSFGHPWKRSNKDIKEWIV